MTTLCCLALAGCAAGAGGAVPTPTATSGVTSVGTPSAVQPTAPPSAPPGRTGTPARSQRIRFVPQQVVLPGGAHASVLQATTVDGELQVPAEAQHVGWWDGGAEAGDPFGSVVLAGHVDTKTEGLGFFARLLRVRRGEVVVLRGSGRTASYRVEAIVSVRKDALATKSGAFDQATEHRLVLITCTGAYDASRGGYEDNLVVTAVPTGLAQ
ncbi:class F sortase [Kribbella shirazensis]|uniref:LPXTG-site transpeptidase (Sortase) family protein n=1 Tax=Kribbella shirazensis TaxID=1105143 RepID=A0A7X5ZZ57_9ACTN|nr:LPXTG-site transpeptidase (sortase) family protein [Kribbella shirazensis]